MVRIIRNTWRCTPLLALAVAVSLASPALSDGGSRPGPLGPLEIAKVQPQVPVPEIPPLRLDPSAPPRTDDLPVYRPPRRGAPRAKVGGGLRGASALPKPLALAPDHLARTVSAQPSLFWHIDAVPSRDSRLVFTLIDADGADPIVEATLDAPLQPGIQRIQLSDHGVELARGVEYEWSVALVVDAAHRGQDVISMGYIERVAEPGGLGQGIPTAAQHAAAGLWYDAIGSISDSIEATPSDPRLRRQRSALLRAAGLEAAVD